MNAPPELAPLLSTLAPSSVLFDHGLPLRSHDFLSHNVHQRFSSVPSSNIIPPSQLPYLELSSEHSSLALGPHSFYDNVFTHHSHPELSRVSWRQPQQLSTPPEWLRAEEKLGSDYPSGVAVGEDPLKTSPSQPSFQPRQNGGVNAHEVRLSFRLCLRMCADISSQPINFLSLLHPSSSPPYHVFVARIIKSSDQQASIFLQQKLKVADLEERHKIVDAICARGFEMMSHRLVL